MSNDLQTLKQWLTESKYTVVLSGAGISTESGLPDFRSARAGLWKYRDQMKLASTDAMKKNRDEFVEFYQYRVEELLKYAPNIGHQILAKWESEGKLQSIITQNVDGFHQLAGSQSLAELHGTLRSCHCSGCRKSYPIASFLENDLTCDCGNFIRPSVVLFGESLPEKSVLQATLETRKAELFIVLGSSLSVSPANYFPMDAKENGAKLVIINMEQTEMDDLADMVINKRKIGEVLQELNSLQ